MVKTVETLTSPVVDWEVRGVPEYNALLLHFQYLSSELQKPKDANQSPNYFLTQDQATELANMLASFAANLPGQQSGTPPYESRH